MQSRFLSFVLFSLLAGASCAGEDFPPEGQLREERLILAISTEPPLVHGGESFTVRALTHWPDATANHLWLLCVPDISSGVFDESDTCVSNHHEAGDPILPCTDPSLPNPCLLGEEPEASFFVPAGLIPSGFEAFFYIQLVVSSETDVLGRCSDAIADGIPELDWQIGVKTVPVVSDDSTKVNINPVLYPLDFDGVTVDGTETPEVTLTDATPFTIVTLPIDATSIDEIIPTDGEPKTIRLDLKVYTDCGKLNFYGDPEEYGWSSGYHREVKCEDLADGNGPVCAPVFEKWTPEGEGECKILFVLWDLYGGVSWIEQHVLVIGP